MSTIIVANGKFPENPALLNMLAKAKTIVCCDGAVERLINAGFQPDAIVGDLDSIAPELRKKYADRLFHNPDQDCNDLTKAVRWCKHNGLIEIVILGATGFREDHTLGNISLLPSYAKLGMNVQMRTDYGIIRPVLESTRFDSFPGQAVSIFSPANKTSISSRNLEYPLDRMQIEELWQGTLNKSLGTWFELEFEPGPLIVFQSYTL